MGFLCPQHDTILPQIIIQLTFLPGAAMDETHVFKVRTSWISGLGGNLWRYNSDLILRPDRVQLNNEVLLAEDIQWIRLQVMSLVHTGVTTGTTSSLELGGHRKSLSFFLHDTLWSTVRTSTFSEIWSVVYRFYGSRILERMLDIIASRGSYSVGKIRFRLNGVEVPKKRLLTSGDPQMVPWAKIRCEVSTGTLRLTVADDRTLAADESLWKTENACLVETLVQYMQQALSKPNGA